ncbi:hypothetical protein GF382_03235 [Candidatus Falkowbacteria bacterium]|nr:hypothetical protein [Candidatus Falkowbacteria bacterium]
MNKRMIIIISAGVLVLMLVGVYRIFFMGQKYSDGLFKQSDKPEIEYTKVDIDYDNIIKKIIPQPEKEKEITSDDACFDLREEAIKETGSDDCQLLETQKLDQGRLDPASLDRFCRGKQSAQGCIVCKFGCGFRK